MLYSNPRFLTGGEKTLYIEFGDSIDISINSLVYGLKSELQKQQIAGVVDAIPAYCSLMINFDPLQIRLSELKQIIRRLIINHGKESFENKIIVEIPTFYGEEYGPDLSFVAEYHDLSIKEVVEIHTKPTYHVYMIGFMPGFPYLGGMAPSLATPRMETPRLTIAAGSVGIAGNQTGIYPSMSPGGWRIIGRTPLCLFNQYRNPPSLLKAGDRLKFRSIDRDEFEHLLASRVESLGVS
jgi:KipI family sensor histidine kinase inhibitor